MTLQTADTVLADEPRFVTRMFRMLLADKFALCAAIFLLFVLILAIVGPSWLGDLATKQNLRGRNAVPFDWERGWVWWMGADADAAIGICARASEGRQVLAFLRSRAHRHGWILGDTVAEHPGLLALRQKPA